jgi:hypothetical protein
MGHLHNRQKIPTLKTDNLKKRGVAIMSATRNIFLWAIFSVSCMAAFNAHAATVSYTLDNVFLVDGRQVTGAFDWTYNVDDFEGGEGVFTALEIPWFPPWTLLPLEEEGMVLTIEFGQIEISSGINAHDYGLDISLKYPLGLSSTQSTAIDETISSYQCCGNGNYDQNFKSGGMISPGMISPIPIPAAAWLFGSALLGLGFVKRNRA